MPSKSTQKVNKYKSHYIPQTVLKSFGNHVILYDIDGQIIQNGLTSTQMYFIPGLYDNDVEDLLNKRLEYFLNEKIQDLKNSNNHPNTELITYFRKYLIISYIRTPFFKSIYPKDRWNNLLKLVITNGINVDYKDGAIGRVPEDNIKLLINGNIQIVESGHSAEPFMINDMGVTFIDSDNAVYPFSKNKAIWISTSEECRRALNSEDVLTVNGKILSQIHGCLGLVSTEECVQSIIWYMKDNPHDGRYNTLFAVAKELDSPENEFNDEIRKKSGIGIVTIPKSILPYLEGALEESDIIRLEEKKDYGTLAGLIVLERFGILGSSMSAMDALERSIPANELDCLSSRYTEYARFEFEKCCGIVMEEIASKHGSGHASNYLYRHYKNGSHTIKDKEKSDYYLHKGCEQGDSDCLIVYFQSIKNDIGYRDKIAKYQDVIPNNGNVYNVLATIYEEHGDEDGYLRYLEKAARCGYGGAINDWVKYWTGKIPIDIEKIEEMNDLISTGKYNAAVTLGWFYHNHRKECPGKFEWLVEKLKETNSTHLGQLLKKCGIVD